MTEKAITYKQGFSNYRDVYLQKITYEPSLLFLLLHSQQSQSAFAIKFNSVYSFSFADEGDLLKYLPETTVGIYTIENSEYLTWFNKENNNVYADENILHFLIATSNEVIDVLTSSEPEIKSTAII